MSRSHKSYLEISRSAYFMLPARVNKEPTFWKKARSETSFYDLDGDYMMPRRKRAPMTLPIAKSVFTDKNQVVRGLWKVRKAATRPRFRVSEDTFTGRLLIPDDAILFEVFEPAAVEILSQADVAKNAYRIWMK